MKTIYACRCGSTRLWRDAAVAVNDEENVVTYDNVSCGDCSYDGHTFRKAEVPDDFDDDRLTPEQLAAAEEVHL
jgi:hypothetical protein